METENNPSLEKALAKTEEDANTSLRAAQSVVGALRKIRNAAKVGNLKDLRTAIDAADKVGLEVPPIPEDIRNVLREFVPAGASVNNPVDLTGDGDAPMFKKAADTVRPYFDTVVYLFGDPIEGASEIVQSDASELVIFMGGADVERREKTLMQKHKVPVFPTPERGIKAFSQLFRFPLIEPREKI